MFKTRLFNITITRKTFYLEILALGFGEEKYTFRLFGLWISTGVIFLTVFGLPLVRYGEYVLPTEAEKK
jgi:hypothetical protein